MATRNTFPTAGGLASSASGLRGPDPRRRRRLRQEGLRPRSSRASPAAAAPARPAARSSAASWSGRPTEAGRGDEDSYARQIADAEHWDLRDVIAVVEIGPKTVSSLEGHRRALTSPYYTKRLELLPDRLEKVRNAIRSRDLAPLGPVLEEEAVDLHLIAMSSHPPIFYWSPGTIAVLRAVRELRQEGLAAWATMDAGANVHVICDPDSEDDVAERLEDLPAVGFVIRDGVGPAARSRRRSICSEPRPIVLIKLGGSLITEKARRGDAAPRGDRPPGRRDRPRRGERPLRDSSSATAAAPSAHVAAQHSGIAQGLRSAGQLPGVSRTQQTGRRASTAS